MPVRDRTLLSPDTIVTGLWTRPLTVTAGSRPTSTAPRISRIVWPYRRTVALWRQATRRAAVSSQTSRLPDTTAEPERLATAAALIRSARPARFWSRVEVVAA